MASFEDAVAGWEIYRNRQGSVSRTQLNQGLRAQGLEPIAERTFVHYGKLLRLGYSEYVSINRLDIRHANESIFDVSDRSRYQDRSIDRDARLILPTAASLITLAGAVGKVSEGFAVLRVQDTDEAREASKAVKYNKGVLVFDEVGVERAVRVREAVERSGELDLLLEFRSLLETDLLLPESPYPLTSTHLKMELGPDASVYRVLGAVHATFDLFESVRGFIDLTVAASAADAPASPTLRVKHLQFANPLEVVLVGAIAVAGGVSYVVNRVAASLGNAAEAASKVQAVGHEREAERRREELHQVKMKSLQLDNLKKAIEIAPLLEELRPDLTEIAGVAIPEPSHATEHHLEALKDQAVEAAVELEMTSDQTLEVQDGDLDA